MDFFRTMVLVATAAGLIAGLGMTAAQELTTVPLILKAELFEQAEEAMKEFARQVIGTNNIDHCARL